MNEPQLTPHEAAHLKSRVTRWGRTAGSLALAALVLFGVGIWFGDGRFAGIGCLFLAAAVAFGVATAVANSEALRSRLAEDLRHRDGGER